jgi:oligoribonuclease (3'-5' exoribonuclease)
VSNHYFITDVETGGLDCEKHAITQMAYLIVDPSDFEILTEGSFYFKPYAGLKVEKEALKKSKVSMSDIENGKDPEKVLNKLLDN